MQSALNAKTGRLLRTAFILGMVTVAYNIVEGLVCTFFGIADATIALFGFGIDSFVEVISGVGIVHMIWRIRRGDDEMPDRFERQALRITGFSFYLLAIGLVASSLAVLVLGSRPDTTVVGLIVSIVSIITMWCLYYFKLQVGTSLNSDAIIADAHCTRTCFNLSFILLAASAIYQVSGIGYVDAIGGIGIAIVAWREGREAMEKARGNTHCCCCGTGDDASCDKPNPGC